MTMLTSNKEALLDLLRTNNASNYLQRRSSNKYVAALHELLSGLGFGQELRPEQVRDMEYYGEETIRAIRSFASRNRLSADGMAVPPDLLHLMIMRSDAIEGLQLLQRSIANRQAELAFNLDDPTHFGTQQLRILLENLDIFEENVRYGLNLYAQGKGLYATYQLTDPLAQSILSDLTPYYGTGLNLNPAEIAGGDNNNNNNNNYNDLDPLPVPLPELEVVIMPDFVTVTDGRVQVQFKKHYPIGISTGGSHSITRFINENRDKLIGLDLSPSAIAVMQGVSLNEGSFDGINTYDRGFLSMGIFQWTLGQEDREGELPALLKKIKSYYPATYRTFFNAHDIDVSESTNTTYGYLTFKGSPVSNRLLKDLFREPRMAYRFWRAAQEPDVQAVQIEHAISRLKNFYWKESNSVMGYSLNKLITSSYGVALLLDNHVNRPSWVAKCVEQAMLNAGLYTDPAYWTSQEEQTLINTYLAVRETYSENTTAPMTAARKRANKMYEGVQQGWLSMERGSFQMSTTDLAIRSSALQPLSYEAPSTAAFAKEVLPPPFYTQEDYPDIRMEINQ